MLKEYLKCLGVSNFHVFVMSTLKPFCPRWALCEKQRCIGCIDPVDGPGKSKLSQLCCQTPSLLSKSSLNLWQSLRGSFVLHIHCARSVLGVAGAEGYAVATEQAHRSAMFAC